MSVIDDINKRLDALEENETERGEELDDLEDKTNRIQRIQIEQGGEIERIDDVENRLAKDEFSTRKHFFKEVIFENKVRFTQLSDTSSNCTQGELAVVGGKLYICSATNTWSVVGDQTA